MLGGWLVNNICAGEEALLDEVHPLAVASLVGLELVVGWQLMVGMRLLGAELHVEDARGLG